MKISKFFDKLVDLIKSIFHKKNKDEDPKPQPEPAPEPVIPTEDFTPPTRTGKDLYTGNGKFNTFKDLERAKESSNKQVTISGWFNVKTWSGGGSEQPQGFCFACKGLVGSHWGINLTVRPNQLVWNATKGEVTANCKISTGSWHHVKAEATTNSVKFWLDGKLLTTGEKKFSGSLIQDSNEILRLGGYYCPYPQAVWFNQSLNGQISDYSISMK